MRDVSHAGLAPTGEHKRVALHLSYYPGINVKECVRLLALGSLSENFVTHLEMMFARSEERRGGKEC